MSILRPFKLSICPKATTPEAMKKAVFGWELVEVNGFDDIKKLATSIPYSSSVFRDYEDLEIVEKYGKKQKESQRTRKNVIGILPIAIFDIDDGLSMKETEQILNRKSIKYMMLTTKSHGTEKANGEDRFRLFVPLSFKNQNDFISNGLKLPEDARRRMNNLLELKYLYGEIAKELEIYEHVDKSPLVDVARKYMPSPKNAEVIIKNIGENFDISKAGLSAYHLAQAELNDKKRKREIAAKIRQKNNSYSQLKNNKYKTYIDFGVLYSLDAGEVIFHYEDKQEPTRLYTEGNYTYVHNATHKYSIIFDEAKGEYVYHDFKSGESGNLLTYMRELLPDCTIFEIALKLQSDFKNELHNTKIIKSNPAYYLEPFKEKLKTEIECSYSEIKSNYLKEMDLKNVSLKRNGVFTVTNKNGYSLNFKLEKEQLKEFSDVFLEFNKRFSEKTKKNFNETEIQEATIKI